MSRKALARNAVWNILGTAVEAVTGFILAPYLIHRLGETTYGLWIILGSLAGYFGLLDLGIRGSVGRHVALYRARLDQDGVNCVLSSALAFLGAAALLAVSGMVLIRPLFDAVYEFPAEQADDVHAALLVVGLTLGVTLLANAFDATLWGFQRFDLLNLVDIPAALARLGATIYFIGQDARLLPLAVINLIVAISITVVKAGLCFWECPALRCGWRFLSAATFREMAVYGSWSFIFSLSRTARTQLSPLLIGAVIGVAMTTPFAVANRLVTLMGMVLAAMTGIFTPYATSLHALGKTDQQQKLFVLGGRFCLALALFMAGGLVFLGEALITLWVGSGLAFAATLLVVLATGEILPNSQYVTTGIIFAKAEQRLLAILSIFETVLVAGLLVALVPRHGLLGACWAVILPGVLCRGFGQIWQGCRLMDVSLLRYGWESLLPAALGAAVPVAVLGWVVAWRPPVAWTELVLYSMGFVLLFMVSCLPLLTGTVQPLPTSLTADVPESTEEQDRVDEASDRRSLIEDERV